MHQPFFQQLSAPQRVQNLPVSCETRIFIIVFTKACHFSCSHLYRLYLLLLLQMYCLPSWLVLRHSSALLISGWLLARWLKTVTGWKDVVILNIRLLSHRIDGRAGRYCITSIILMESSCGVMLDKNSSLDWNILQQQLQSPSHCWKTVRTNVRSCRSEWRHSASLTNESNTDTDVSLLRFIRFALVCLINP
jgi:hypothetical protein